jgi:hypothetical protein
LQEEERTRWHWGMLIATTVLALAYLGWVFASRHFSALPPKAPPDPELARRQAELDRIYGGSELKILQFYPAAGDVIEGTPTTMCYGVLNATSVRIEPPVDGVGVSINRCVQAVPRKDTRYTLFAEGRDGAVLSKSFVIHTHPRPPTPPGRKSP